MRMNPGSWLSALVIASALLAPSRLCAGDGPEFQARIAGKPVELHAFSAGAFASYEFTEPVDIVIRTGFDIRWVNVRPRSSGVNAVISADHHEVRFRATSLLPLTVEFNDDIAYVVHLFAYAPERDAPTADAPNVRFYGPGVHDAGLIELSDGQTLYLAAGAWVKGNVRSVGTRNVSIRGRGVLDGSDISMRPRTKGEDIPGGNGTRNMVYLEHTEGASIEGITIFNSESAWTFFMKGANGTHVDHVNILNPSMRYGNDGFDVVSSSHVLIENIFVRTNDDCVVVKNLLDVDTHDIVVRHAVLWNMPTGGNGLEVGFETRNAPVHGVHFSDVDLIHVERGSAISVHNCDASTVSDITFDDIRVEDVRRKLVDLGIFYAQYGLDKPADRTERARRLDKGGSWDGQLTFTADEKPERAKFRGRIRNVTITNLHVIEGSLPYSIIAGFDPEHDIEGVVIEGLQYQGRPILNAQDGKFTIEDAQGVVFR